MKKAIQIAYNDLFEKKCEYAAIGGFKHIAVNFTEIMDKTQDDWDAVIEDIERILEKTGIKCIQSHPYYYDLLLSSEILKEECEFAIKQAIRASGKLGAAWCALHPRSSISGGFCSSKSLADNKKAFSEYLEYAYKYNTGLAAENLPIFPFMSPSMPFYSSDYEELCVLVDGFADDRVGICWDTGHANLVAFDQAEAVKTLGSRIKCTHIHNNFRQHDDHLSPENGKIEWEKVMAAFREIGFDGPLTLETHCRYNEPGLLQSFARHNYACLEYLERLAEKK